MDVAYVSALSALAGSVVGGLTAGITSWLGLHAQARAGQLAREMSPPSVKQHLACIRMLFDWMVTGQVLPSNPAHSVDQKRT